MWKRANCSDDTPAFPLPQSRYGDAMNMIIPVAALLLLSACGASDNDPGPGGVSVGEAKALDEAAAMIEAKRLPQEAEAQAPPDRTGEPVGEGIPVND
ncbi:hypothetical protein [Pontixanthobacter sp.]|uniref:hypothetical protein n=1 Tax=Pontixanthobacter sp. TaxID=2792078 RepID=UPI003C7AD5BF